MAIELLYTEPFSAKIETRVVAGASEVETFASELQARYQSAGDMLPGIELRREGGESLSIAIAPFGWALVHTDADFTQHCTRCDGSTEDASHDVRWEEPDSVRGEWFIPQQDALAGVAQWMADGTLSPQLTWSDQCL